MSIRDPRWTRWRVTAWHFDGRRRWRSAASTRGFASTGSPTSSSAFACGPAASRRSSWPACPSGGTRTGSGRRRARKSANACRGRTSTASSTSGGSGPTSWSTDQKMSRSLHRLRHGVLPNLRYLTGTRVRRCRCCQRFSVIVSLSPGDEVKRCLICGANLRYEMLAEQIRKLDLEGKTVVELDPSSPLRQILMRASRYIRTYYSPTEPAGSVRPDGARREDVTDLSFAAGSIDLMVSSDVLEHVPNLERAFAETARVLKPGGLHLFTVPPRGRTRRRPVEDPEYHRDPLDPAGILAHWDIGPDAAAIFSTETLRLQVVAGPEGADRRVVWQAERT
ncbi:MAG: class I SAM-dependent methyltransferase [Chloroflexi bacterium]|nr:MAG: class I SAM-dependent methyltransferase [Chloroflexota bacterium]